MNYLKVNEKAEKIAAAVIFALGLPRPDIQDLILWVAKSFGFQLEVVQMDLLNVPVCGLVFFNPKTRAYKIIIDKNDSKERQKFSVCHEIAHALRERELIYGFFDGNLKTEDAEERFCNRFAAAFLMPEKVFKERWKSTSRENFLIKKYLVAEYFGVSKETVYYRALELGLL
jgi:Zn-dependent peptidase ImmA (M78 family)